MTINRGLAGFFAAALEEWRNTAAKRGGFHTFYKDAQEMRALERAFEAAGARRVKFRGSFTGDFDIETMGSGIARCDLDASGVAALRAQGFSMFPGRQLI